MTPAHPPLPTAWNFPFQFSAGSHTSIAISESADGRSTAATRQCAGNMIAGCAGAAPRPRPAPGAGTDGAGAAGAGPPAPGPAGVYSPAGTVSAAVIVVPVSAIDFRLSQGADAARAADKARLAIMDGTP